MSQKVQAKRRLRKNPGRSNRWKTKLHHLTGLGQQEGAGRMFKSLRKAGLSAIGRAMMVKVPAPDTGYRRGKWVKKHPEEALQRALRENNVEAIKSIRALLARRSAS